MRRGDFEDLVRRHLDGELVPRGFTLIPQPPADWDDDQPRAVYEARPDEFDRRYPALAVGADPQCPGYPDRAYTNTLIRCDSRSGWCPPPDRF